MDNRALFKKVKIKKFISDVKFRFKRLNSVSRMLAPP